jgi:hypothetical protein
MLKQGQRVSCTVTGLTVTGVVCGKAQNDQPIIGGAYIIQPDTPISNDVYPYSHFVMHENLMKKID